VQTVFDIDVIDVNIIYEETEFFILFKWNMPYMRVKFQINLQLKNLWYTVKNILYFC